MFFVVFFFKGMIFVFNEWNEIISYLKLCRPVDSLNVQSFCLDDFGEKLIHFQHDSFEQKIKIRIYQTQSKNPLERNGKQPYKMNLIEKKDLQTDYFPGKSQFKKITKIKIGIKL